MKANSTGYLGDLFLMGTSKNSKTPFSTGPKYSGLFRREGRDEAIKKAVFREPEFD